MKKLIAIYPTPDDRDAFLAHYKSTHIPLVRRLPGLIRVEATLVERTLVGEQGTFLVTEMVFADQDALKAALKSPENAAVGADLANFEAGKVTVIFGDVIDEKS